MAASSVDTTEVERMIEHAVDAMDLTKEDMAAAGSLVLERILDRLMEGKGADGQLLAPYKLSTRRSRAKRGRRTDIVNLMDTGRMVSFLASVSGKKHATIYVTSSTEREKLKRLEEGTRHMKPRVILDENEGDMEAVADLLLVRLTQRLG